MAQDKILPGYEQSVGAKLQAIVDHYGPISYSQTTGDVYPATNLSRGGFDKVVAGKTFSGIYNVSVQYPNGWQGGGVPSVVLTWLFAPQQNAVLTVVVGAAGSGYTNGTYISNATGGGGTGAQVQYVVAGGAVTAPTVINPGSGYTSAPTFTVSAPGGTAGTLTATVGSTPGGTQPANGANLSSEAVRIEVLMY